MILWWCTDIETNCYDRGSTYIQYCTCVNSKKTLTLTKMTTKKTTMIVGDADEQKRVADIGYGGIDIKMGDSEGGSGDIEGCGAENCVPRKWSGHWPYMGRRRIW